MYSVQCTGNVIQNVELGTHSHVEPLCIIRPIPGSENLWETAIAAAFLFTAEIQMQQESESMIGIN